MGKGGIQVQSYTSSDAPGKLTINHQNAIKSRTAEDRASLQLQAGSLHLPAAIVPPRQPGIAIRNAAQTANGIPQLELVWEACLLVPPVLGVH